MNRKLQLARSVLKINPHTASTSSPSTKPVQPTPVKTSVTRLK